MTPPSSYAVMNAVNELEQVRDQLVAICPDIEQDEALFADMLEGEAGDSLRIIEHLIDASVESDALADAVTARQKDLAERKVRFEKRRDAYRTVALQVLERINLRKLERASWTASIRALPPPVHIDETVLPEVWWRTKREPMKAEIRKALLAGDPVDGAQLGNAATGLSIRTR